jgi:adenosylcobinamide-GDP ribazoletransferase
VTAGVRLALTTFTVAPVRAGRVDRRAAATAMTLAPLIGAALGALTAAAGLGLRAAGAPVALAAAVTVAADAALTRGLHLDGLADTADGLGCYGDRDRALAVMKAPDVGAFGVVAIAVALLIQTAGTAALLAQPLPRAVAGLALAAAAGRLAVTWACRRGVPAARPDGLGALVAGTVPLGALAVATAAVGLAAVWAVPGRPWHGPLAVVAAIAVVLLFVRHVIRRLGGVTGDVLGAVVEVGSLVALTTLATGG